MVQRGIFSIVVLTDGSRVALLQECLRSVQNLRELESVSVLVTLLAGRTFGAVQTVRAMCLEFGVGFLECAAPGVGAARNAAIAQSTQSSSEFVAFLADDYTVPPNYVTNLRSAFETYPDAAVITARLQTRGSLLCRTVYDSYLDLSVREWLVQKEGALAYSYRIPASKAAAFRREVFDQVGNFREDLTVGEDTELGWRLARHGKPVQVLADTFVLHQEDRSLTLLLKQRWNYGRAYLRLRAEGPRGHRFSIFHAVTAVAHRLYCWLKLSLRSRRFLRFTLELPALTLLLVTFHLGICFESARYTPEART